MGRRMKTPVFAIGRRPVYKHRRKSRYFENKNQRRKSLISLIVHKSQGGGLRMCPQKIVISFYTLLLTGPSVGISLTGLFVLLLYQGAIYWFYGSPSVTVTNEKSASS